MTIKLRPHHLLCTQGYSGKGYSTAFTANMTRIVDHLRNESRAAVEIVFSTDDICACCPDRLGPDACRENAKVKEYDRKVCAYFGIREETYIYKDITRAIRERMTEPMMEDICGTCAWYPVSACKRNIVGDKL